MPRRKGVALILGLGCTVLFTAIVILSVTAILSGVTLTRYASNSMKAFYLAESGAQKALYELRKNWGWAGQAAQALNWADGFDAYNGGDYEVTVTTVDSSKRVISTGYYPQKYGAYAKRAIEVYISIPSPSWFFDNAITASEDVILRGSFTVNGNIVYGETIDPVVPNSQQLDAAKPLPLLDFAQLKNMAMSQIKPDGLNNLYTAVDIEDGKPFPTSFWFDETNQVPNVVYVETNLVLNGNIGTIGGFFVVAGDVITDPNAGADTTINGNGTIDGCVYTLGEFRINGGGNGLGVTGGVWAADDARLNGNATVGYNADYMNAIKNSNIAFKAQITQWKEKPI